MKRRDYLVIALLLIVAGGIVVGVWLAVRPTPDDPNIIKHDPIEDDPAYQWAFEAADSEAQKEHAKNGPHRLGSVHGFYAIKKRILKEKYGIEWKTPPEMNPKWAFD